MTGATPPIAGVSRVVGVYTPPEHRGNGYASACVATVTRSLLDEGSIPILNTQLANPTSNSIYRQLGYHPVQEVLIYQFGRT